MKIIGFDNEEKQGTLGKQPINITNMYFCYLTVSGSDDCSSSQYLNAIFMAHTESGEIVEFIHAYQESVQNIVNGFGNSGFLVQIPNRNENLFRVSDFVLDDLSYGITSDFFMEYNHDTHRFEFAGLRADTMEWDLYSVTKQVVMGLRILNKSIFDFNITQLAVREANLWMSSSNEVRNNFRSDMVQNMEILELSRTVKKDKTHHIGLAIMKLETTGSDGCTRNIVVSMPYCRSTKLRSRKKTTNMELLEMKYKDSYVGSAVMGLDMTPSNTDLYMFIAKRSTDSDAISESVVLIYTVDMYKEFIKMVEEV